jgi:hypothetical protein
MYREGKILSKSSNLNLNGEIFLSKLSKKNFFDDPKNIQWYESTMHDMLSLELTNNDNDLQTIFLKSSSFFQHRGQKDHGSVLVPSQQEISLKKFKLEIEKVENGNSMFTLFNLNGCKNYFQVDFMLYNKLDR